MKTIVFVISLFISIAATAQINVGSREKVKLNPGEFDPENLEELKNSKTYFVYREDDVENLESLKAALKSVWTITELHFISYDEFKKGNWNGNYSFFTLGGYTKVTDSGTMIYTNTYIYLVLWMEINGKPEYFARIELFPTFPTYQKADKTEEEEEMIEYLYKSSTFRNWFPGYLKNSLKFVNDKLEQNQVHWLFKSDTYGDVSKLKNDTLYIPDYILIKFNKFNGDESQKHELEELLKDYPYPVKVVSVEELSNMILTRTSDFYYLSYIKSSTTKYINVFNGFSGELMYSDHDDNSYNIKPKDMKGLAKAISK